VRKNTSHDRVESDTHKNVIIEQANIHKVQIAANANHISRLVLFYYQFLRDNVR